MYVLYQASLDEQVHALIICVKRSHAVNAVLRLDMSFQGLQTPQSAAFSLEKA